MPELNKYWQVKAEAGTEGKQRVTLLFYGDISMYPNWYEEDKSAQEIANELKGVAAQGEIEHITVRINSPGGSAFGGLAISNILRAWPAPVTTHVDGLAGSAASLIFAAGDERVMPANTLLFIHNPLNGIYGYAADMRKMADTLDQIAGAVAATYKEITGLSDEEIKALMDGETWMNATQAKEMGFATSIDRIPVAASLRGKEVTINGVTFNPADKKLTLPEDYLNSLPVNEETTDEEANAEIPTPENHENQENQTNQGSDNTADNAEIPTPENQDNQANQTNQGSDEIRAEAYAAGVAAERARNIELDEMATPNTAALIADARKVGTPTADIAKQIVTAMKASGQGAAYLAAVQADAASANRVVAGVSPTNDHEADQVSIADMKSFWPYK